MIDHVLFGALAAGTLLAALMVVRTEDLVHAVLWLAVTLVGTAGLYVTLDAGFLAAIQILLYTGGVITLMLFAVMLARREPGAVPAGLSDGRGRAVLVAAAVLGLVGSTVGSEGAHLGSFSETLDTQALGVVLLGPLALPFEVLSVLLLAGMIGAIVLARRKDA